MKRNRFICHLLKFLTNILTDKEGISNLQDGIVKSLKILNCSPTILEKDSSTLEVKIYIQSGKKVKCF